MRTRFFSPRGLVFAWMLATSFCLPEYASAQEADYDDDTGLDFVWTPPEGSFDHYNIYVSVDNSAYQLDGTSSTQAYTVSGQNGHNYTIKVSAVTSGGTEGPFSPESDPVICDTVAPLIPTISQTYDVLDQNTIVLSIESGPSDINFSNYQLLGGQYADWTDTSETTTFVFSVDPDSHNVVEVREKDLAGNVGPEASVTVENLSGDNDSDGIPNYWEYMYREILDAENPADANVDSDGDGWSNYEEFLAGTDPTKKDSAPVDTVPPTIVCLTGNTTASRGESVTINAALDDNVAVTEAWLHYKGANAPSWASVDFLSGSASITVPEDRTEDIYYYITADDAAGNGPVGDPSVDGSVYYTITVLDGTQVLNLAEGWNLVGISHQPLDPSASSIFGGVAVGSVWGWDGSKNVPVASVEPLHAYWVLTSAPASVQYDYVPVSDPTPDLSGLWNMFAVAEETALPLPYPNVVGSVWGWDANKYVRMENALQPHKGYWVAAEVGGQQQQQSPTGSLSPLSGQLLSLEIAIELSGVDKGNLEIGLVDENDADVVDPAPPASPDGFRFYILCEAPPPFDSLAKSLVRLSPESVRTSWIIVAQIQGGSDLSLSWNRDDIPEYMAVTLAELNIENAAPKAGSIEMSTTEQIRASAALLGTLAWRVEATCRAMPSQDADGDLIADDWEQQCFGQGGCDASADPDGDGMSNLQEFIAGTDPNSDLSLLTISEIYRDAISGSAMLSLETVPDRKYQVFYRDSLTEEWLCLGTEFEGAGSAIHISDNAISSDLSKRFYRVRVW